MHVSVSVYCSSDTESQVPIHGVFCVVEVYISESISHKLLILKTYTAQHAFPHCGYTFPNRQYLVAVLLTKRAPHSPMQKAPPLPPANHGSGPPASHDLQCLCLQLWGGPAGNVRSMRNNYQKHRTSKLCDKMHCRINACLHNYTYATQFATMLL